MNKWFLHFFPILPFGFAYTHPLYTDHYNNFTITGHPSSSSSSSSWFHEHIFDFLQCKKMQLWYDDVPTYATCCNKPKSKELKKIVHKMLCCCSWWGGGWFMLCLVCFMLSVSSAMLDLFRLTWKMIAFTYFCKSPIIHSTIKTRQGEKNELHITIKKYA